MTELMYLRRMTKKTQTGASLSICSNSEQFMKIDDLISFVSIRNRSLEEVLRYLTLETISFLEPTSTLVVEVNKQNRIKVLDGFGVDPGELPVVENLSSINEPLPLNKVLRSKSTVWVNTLPEWGDGFPTLNGNWDFPELGKTFIGWPIEKYGVPTAAIGTFCKPVIDQIAEIEPFIKAIGNVMALQLYYFDSMENGDSKANYQIPFETYKQGDEELTERQLLILKMIAEGRTNSDISDVLNYSESTIRQETIKIYSKLNCSGRPEARQIYLNQISKQDSAALSK